MIVCVCEGLSERAISHEIQRGARTVAEIGQRCGAGQHCGMCRRDLKRMVRHAHPCAGTDTGMPPVMAAAPMD